MDKMDWIEIRQKLEEKSKSEILDIVEKLIHEKPGIVTSMNYLLNRTEEDPIIDMFSIESRIDDAIYGDLDYYHLDDALNKLYEVQHSAQSLQKKHHWKNAAEIYFKLIDASIEAYESGADDSSGSLGWFTQDCIKAFNECTKNIDDQEYNTGFVKSVLELIFREDYGMEPEKMLENIVTSENIGMIEEE